MYSAATQITITLTRQEAQEILSKIKHLGALPSNNKTPLANLSSMLESQLELISIQDSTICKPGTEVKLPLADPLCR